jgi:hypothetical protein
MRKIILITLIFISHEISSQNKFLDFIVTHNNDTIYGRYRGNKLIDPNKKSHKVNRKIIKTIRSDDKIYHLALLKNKDFFSDENDSLIEISKNQKPLFKKESYYYVRKLNKKERKDFIVTNNNDTIFGKIKQITFGGKKLVTELGEKYPVSSSKLFREKGAIFLIRNDLRTKGNLTSPNEVELLYNGRKAKLFKQVIENPNYYNVHYYIEKDGKMELIIPERFTKMITRIMPENKKMLNKLRKREYTYYDIYLVIKYFNEN